MARRGGTYRYTPKRRAALKKAQLLSARKRRGKKIAIGAGAVGVGVLAVGGGVLAAKHIRGTRAGKKNIVTHNPAPVRAVSGARVQAPAQDIVAHPPTVVAKPHKTNLRRGPLHDSNDISHLSSTAKKLYESYTQKSFIVEGQRKIGDTGGSSPSRVVKYTPSEKHLASLGQTSSTNPMVRMIMNELKKDHK